MKDVTQSLTPYAPTEVLVYSLRTHTVVKRLGAPHLDDPRFGLDALSTDGSEPAEDFCNVVEITANASFVAIVRGCFDNRHGSFTDIELLRTPRARTARLQSTYCLPPRSTFSTRSLLHFLSHPSHHPLPLFRALSSLSLTGSSPMPLLPRSRTPVSAILGPASSRRRRRHLHPQTFKLSAAVWNSSVPVRRKWERRRGWASRRLGDWHTEQSVKLSHLPHPRLRRSCRISTRCSQGVLPSEV